MLALEQIFFGLVAARIDRGRHPQKLEMFRSPLRRRRSAR
jgi:hypothetical protein